MSGLRYRAVLIGNSIYEALPNLFGPQNDVGEIDDALFHSTWGLFRPGDVTRLVNKPRREVRERLRTFFDEATADDVLLLFFSGHGERGSGGLYFCLSDTKSDRLEATGLAASEISGYARRSPSQRVVILLDCCHSGAYKAGLDASVLQGKGRLVLASTHASLLSPDALDAAEVSPFTDYVRDALTGSAADADGRVTFWALASYVEDRVPGARRFVVDGHGNLDLARRGGLAAIGRSWLDAFDSDIHRPGRRLIRWPSPPTLTEAKTILTNWAERQWLVPSNLVRQVGTVRAASAAGITATIIVDHWQEDTVEWSIAKAEQLPEYRNPLRYASVPLPDGTPLPATWKGARLGTKTKQNCTACLGNGRQPCDRCVSGRVKCPQRQRCPRCLTAPAAGRHNPTRPTPTSRAASGTHTGCQKPPDCPRCNDIGMIDCEKCRGNGWRNCPTCTGRGNVDCEQCDGQGKTMRFTSGTLTRQRRQFHATAAEISPAITSPLRRGVGRLDEVDLRELPHAVRDQLCRRIRHELSHPNEECRSMEAMVDILPASEVAFHDGRRTRTALLLGDDRIVQLNGRQLTAIRTQYAAVLLYHAATNPAERQRLLAAVTALLVVAVTIGLLIAGT